jgi:hypothetical protein
MVELDFGFMQEMIDDERVLDLLLTVMHENKKRAVME